MPDIDRAALLEALGHDEAARVLRALGEPAATTEVPAPPAAVEDPDQGFLEQLQHKMGSGWVSIPLVDDGSQQ